jgi:hypothetical protein
MATVPDLSWPGAYPGIHTNGNLSAVDRNYANSNRTYAGTPNSVLTPAYSGEIMLDTVSGSYWRAGNLTNTSWVQTVIGA